MTEATVTDKGKRYGFSANLTEGQIAFLRERALALGITTNAYAERLIKAATGGSEAMSR